ncbi:MAG: hypothetical protein OQJ77_03475 [Thiovulaceae bacterium]|nr:hypothetical protein [Sulfurimonadaceae bacterium]
MKSIYLLASTTLFVILFLGCSTTTEKSIIPTKKLKSQKAKIKTLEDAKKAIIFFHSINALNNTTMNLSQKRKSSNNQLLSNQITKLQTISETKKCLNDGTYNFNAKIKKVKNITLYDTSITYNNCIDNSHNEETKESYFTSNGSELTKGSGTDKKDAYFNNSTHKLKNFKIDSDLYSSISNVVIKNIWEENKLNGTYSSKLTIDGTMLVSYKSPVVGMKIKYKDFELNEFSYDGFDYASSINGTVSVQSTLKGCANGLYTLETIEPLKLSPSFNGYSYGVLVINNTTFEYNVDGSINVTLPNTLKGVIKKNASVTCE